MAKHRQNKGTKKHVKERPRKRSLSDRNHKPPVYSIEVTTNGNFPGAPPVWELFEEPAEGIDTKASVIEALASAQWDAENPVEAAEASTPTEAVGTTAVAKPSAPEIAEQVVALAEEVAGAVAEEVVGAVVEEALSMAATAEEVGDKDGEVQAEAEAAPTEESAS